MAITELLSHWVQEQKVDVVYTFGVDLGGKVFRIEEFMSGEEIIHETNGLLCLEGSLIETRALTALLGSIRNRSNLKVLAFVPDDKGIRFTDLIGFGYRKLSRVPDFAGTLYGYDINSYIRKRDWNNSKYWANPDMFDKARW